jgi:hypothetical protein
MKGTAMSNLAALRGRVESLVLRVSDLRVAIKNYRGEHTLDKANLRDAEAKLAAAWAEVRAAVIAEFVREHAKTIEAAWQAAVNASGDYVFDAFERAHYRDVASKCSAILALADNEKKGVQDDER